MRRPDERRASSRLVGSGVLARVRRLPAALEVRAGEGVRGGGEDPPVRERVVVLLVRRVVLYRA